MWAWLVRHKGWITVGGVLLTIIGFGGLPDDILTWRNWIDESAAWFSDDIGRWILMGIGVVVLIMANADRIPGLKSFVPQIEFVDPPLAAPSPTSAKQSRHVMWCGIRWVWFGRYDFSDPIVVAHCPTHPEVRLQVRDNTTKHIRRPDSSDWISSTMHYQTFYCIRGPHVLLFDGDCETTMFGQVQERAVQLMAADLRKEGLLD